MNKVNGLNRVRFLFSCPRFGFVLIFDALNREIRQKMASPLVMHPTKQVSWGPHRKLSPQVTDEG